LKHIDPDVVLYSLQTLANMINHPGIRRRFRDDGFLQNVFDLLEAEEIDEAHLEAIAALVMNFGSISKDEAKRLSDALDSYEIDSPRRIIVSFMEFLKTCMRVDA
jgi:hypothetical protein